MTRELLELEKSFIELDTVISGVSEERARETIKLQEFVFFNFVTMFCAQSIPIQLSSIDAKILWMVHDDSLADGSLCLSLFSDKESRKKWDSNHSKILRAKINNIIIDIINQEYNKTELISA